MAGKNNESFKVQELYQRHQEKLDQKLLQRKISQQDYEKEKTKLKELFLLPPSPKSPPTSVPLRNSFCSACGKKITIRQDSGTSTRNYCDQRASKQKQHKQQIQNQLQD